MLTFINPFNIVAYMVIAAGAVANSLKRGTERIKTDLETLTNY